MIKIIIKHDIIWKYSYQTLSFIFLRISISVFPASYLFLTFLFRGTHQGYLEKALKFYPQSFFQDLYELNWDLTTANLLLSVGIDRDASGCSYFVANPQNLQALSFLLFRYKLRMMIFNKLSFSTHRKFFYSSMNWFQAQRLSLYWKIW